MPADVYSIILFFIFELFVFFSALRIVYLFTQNNKKNSNIEIILAGISISFLITSLVPTILSFMKFNGIWQYLIFSLLILIILHIGKKSQLTNYKNFLYDFLKNTLIFLMDWRVLVIIGILLPFIFLNIKPTHLSDDLYALNFAFDWMFNLETPYERAFKYVTHWEISFLPSMVITSTDNFLWLNSFKAVILIGLGTYLIGKTINIPKYLTWLSVFSSLLFFNFWYIGTTIGTLKNDFIFAVGIILLIIAFIKSSQGKLNRFHIVFFIMGIVFLTVKYSGITLSIISILFFIFLNRKIISKNTKHVIKWAGIGALVLLGTTGHYYISNYIEFDNPLFPVKLNILGYEIPGNRDWSGTSIIAHIDNDELISKFFPYSEISIGGVFFPVILVFAYLGTGAVIIYGIYNYVRKKKLDKPIILIGFFLLITWLQYLITPFSAGTPNGELEYLKYIQSSRYVLGSIFVTELLLVGILWKLRIPQFAIYSFIIINAVSRYLILIDRLPSTFDISIIIFPILFIVGIFIFGKFVKKFSIRMIILATIILLIFILSPQLVEENRIYWAPEWKNVIASIHYLPPTEIFLMEEPGSNQTWPRVYPVKGDKFQHTIVLLTMDELYSMLNEKSENENIPEYVTLFCKPSIGCDPVYLSEFESLLQNHDFKEIAIDSHSILFKFEK